MIAKSCSKSLWFAVAVIGIFCIPVRTSAQYLVDCTGNTPGAFSTISAALASAGNGANIFVSSPGPCNEDIAISGMSNVSIGAFWDNRVSINGSFNISGSQNVYLYGFDVTSPNNGGNYPIGVLVTNSTNVTLDACTSRMNQGSGLRVDSNSSAYITDWGDYSHNGDSGVSVTAHSYLNMVAWGGEIDMMFNKNSGLYVDRSEFGNLGHVAINDNFSNGSVQPTGFGIDMRGMSTGVMFGIFGVAEVSGNQGGGISLIENSEISIGGNSSWAPYLVDIAVNSPTGISVGFGSQLTMFGGIHIVEHLNTGVDIYGKSQAAIYGDNLITRIGSSMEPGKAAIRVDGNSQLYLRNATITQNGAPGVLALVNSSVDSMGVSFSSNAGPNYMCDSSAYITGDVSASGLGSANPCRIPGLTGAIHRFHAPTAAPSWRAQKVLADRFKALSASVHH